MISYAKARAEASGLYGDGGLIERPDRLIIVLVGAGLTGLGLDWAIHVAMWVLAVLSVVTVGQRMWSIARSPGARDLIPLPSPSAPADDQSGDDPTDPTGEANNAEPDDADDPAREPPSGAGEDGTVRVEEANPQGMAAE